MASDNEALRSSMSGIGEQLRSAREKKGVTIDQVQKQTHIYSGVITALEEGRCDDILTDVYVKAFLKKYAGYLGLDSKTIIKEYEFRHHKPRSYETSEAKGESSVRSIGLEHKPALKLHNLERPGFFKKIMAPAVFILIIFIAFLAVKKVVSLAKDHGPRKAVVAKTFSQKRPAQATALQRTAAEKNSAQNLTIPKSEPLKLELYVKKGVFVKVKADGKLLFGTTLQKGTKRTFTAHNSFNIYMAKTESIELVINGNPVPLAEKGTIKDLEITRSGVKIK